MLKFCFDPRHEVPCEQPCAACEDECDPNHIHMLNDEDDSEYNGDEPYISQSGDDVLAYTMEQARKLK